MYRGRKVAVVVPAHNERARVGRVVATMPAFVDRVILVDDASTDGTAARAREEGDPRVEVARRRSNGGVGAAIVTGYVRALAAGADLVAVMAGDAQMDPADLPRLLDPLVEGGADYAKGNRLAHPDLWRVMPKFRLLGNALLTWITRWATGLRISDSQCGYTAVTREALARLSLSDLYPRYGFPNDLLMKVAAAGLRVRDVMVRPIYHRGPGESGIVLRHFIPRVSWLLAAGAVRRWLGRGEWAPAARRPRVLVLTSSYPRFAGDHAGHFIESYACRLADRFDVTVLAPWDGEASRAQVCAPGLFVRRFRYAPRARWHRVAYASGIEENVSSLAARIWLAPFLAVFILRALGAARRADVVISNWLVPAGAAGALCRGLLARPHLAIEHGGGLWALHGRGEAGRRLLAAILRRTDRVACVSAALRDDLLTEAAASGVRLRARDVALIPMGIETRRFAAPWRRRDIDVLFLGRLVPVKGVETLIDAVGLIPGACLVLAGEGPREAALRERAVPHGHRVQFPGLVHGQTKRELLARAAILAVPSVILPGGRTEGFPLVVLEGMASGCAVVASDVGGIGEVLRDGWNGFLTKPGDATALAERIRWILDHPRQRDAMGTRAAECAAAFEASAVGDRVAAEIDRLLTGPDRIR